LTANEIKAIAAGGFINEDVLQKVYDISPTDTPFLDAIGKGTYDNTYHEFNEDTLAAPGLAVAIVDGATITAATSATGARVGNNSQLTDKTVNVSVTAEASDTIGRTSEVAYQTTRRINEMMNDIEATALSPQASVVDAGTGTPGKTAGFDAWLKTNVSVGASAGAVGGFQTDDKLIDAPTPGNKRNLTWDMISERIEAAYLIGAKPTKLFSVPQITKRIGRYLIDSPYFVAPVANIQGGSPTDVAASGYIDTFRTDFGYTMQVVPCRNQQTYTAGDSGDVATLFGVDPQYVQLSRMWGTKVEDLAKTSHSIQKVVSTHFALDVTLERAHFGIRDLTPTGAVTTSG
jgi:hypothetical protein